MTFFEQLLSRRSPRTRPRVSLAGDFAEIYAIGDVHGRLDLLLELETKIVRLASPSKAPRLLVMLGDYVDRGPQSAGVIDHLLAPPPHGFARVCLAGNHEEMMTEFLLKPSPRADWLKFGGLDTLRSYGASQNDIDLAVGSRASLKEMVERLIPPKHRDFVLGLATVLSLPGYTFVHAGIRPGIPLDDQSDDDLLWIRYEFLESKEDFGTIVVHGHTPIAEAEIHPNRIALDTAAFATGILSGVAIRDGYVEIVKVGPSAT